MDPAFYQMEKKIPAGKHSPDYAAYPKLDPNDADPPPPPEDAPSAVPSHTFISIGVSTPPESNPYLARAPTGFDSMKVTIDTVRDMLRRWGKKVGESTKAAEDLSRNVWQHLKIGPSITEAAMGRIVQSTKVIAEGGYDKIFGQTFDNFSEEQLKHYFACYLSTSAGPVMGTLYISSAKVAFSSDNPLAYKIGNQTEWSFYKVVIPLYQIKAAKSSASNTNPAEKYIQIVSADEHEFWFMGFVSYENAVKNLDNAMKDVYDLHA